MSNDLLKIPSTDPLSEDEFAIIQASPTQFAISMALAGAGGSGKTYTALMLARAFAKGGAFGMVDTESGRGRRYHKYFTYKQNGQDVPYLYGELKAPYAPERYIAAMKAMVNAGAKAIVVDTASLEWEGAGGILEIQNAITGGNQNKNMVGWAQVKPRHRRFIEFAKNSGVHVIMCFRAREKSKPNPDKNAPAYEKIISLGWQPITNELASFEFDLFAMLEPNSNGRLADDANFKNFIDFQEAWKPGTRVDPRICDRIVKIHEKMCEGGEPVKADIQDCAPATQEQQPKAEVANSPARAGGGLQGKLMEIANAETMEDVCRIEDDIDKHRAALKPKQIEALNKALKEAKRRLSEALDDVPGDFDHIPEDEEAFPA